MQLYSTYDRREVVLFVSKIIVKGVPANNLCVKSIVGNALTLLLLLHRHQFLEVRIWAKS